jgi:hypothetical protein
MSTHDGVHTDPNLGDGIWPVGSGDAPDAASGVSESQWISFLNTNNITSFALGLGPGAVQAELDPIASGDGVVVENLADLPGVLTGTLSALPVPGNLLTGSDPDGSFGADGGHVESIAGTDTANIDDTPDGGVLTVMGTEGGKLDVVIDTGAYTYTPPEVIPTGDVTERFDFTLIDGDGDTASAQLSMLIDDPNT